MNRSRVTSNTSLLLGFARLLFDQGDDAVELVVEGGLLSAQLLDLGPQRGVVLLEAGGVLAQLAELGEQLFEGERRPPVLARFRRFILKRHDGRDPPLIGCDFRVRFMGGFFTLRLAPALHVIAVLVAMGLRAGIAAAVMVLVSLGGAVPLLAAVAPRWDSARHDPGRFDYRSPVFTLRTRLVTLAVALIVEAAALATLRARADSRKWLGRFLFLDLR